MQKNFSKPILKQNSIKTQPGNRLFCPQVFPSFPLYYQTNSRIIITGRPTVRKVTTILLLKFFLLAI